jgi:DNA adenine methylase
MVEPILKWAGGKRQMIDKIIDRLPPQSAYNRYFEPFFGGGAVFFKLEPDNGYINDINERLVNFYIQVRDNPEQLISEYQALAEKHRELSGEKQEKYYYERREEFNSLRDGGNPVDLIREAGLLFYLNRSCFNGLYRENQDGDFNVPIGSANSIPLEAGPIRQVHDVLQNTEITANDFTFIEEHVEENDLVYFDPPYLPMSKTANFDKYHESGFGPEQQRHLRDLAAKLDKRGVYVMITNAPNALDWYQTDTVENFRHISVKVNRRINSMSTRRSGHEEVIITNIDPFEARQQTFDTFRDDTTG